jgi:hypothetical protein
VSHDGPVRGHDRRPDASGLARFYADLTGMQVARRVPAGPSGLGEQRREPLHAPVDRDVVDLDAALGE